MARRGDRRAALLPRGDAEGLARGGRARNTDGCGRGAYCGGRSSLAGRERLERIATNERARGDPRAPVSSLIRRLRAVESRDRFGEELQLRVARGRGGPGRGGGLEGARRADRAPPSTGGGRWRSRGTALIPEPHLLVL